MTDNGRCLFWGEQVRVSAEGVWHVVMICGDHGLPIVCHCFVFVTLLSLFVVLNSVWLFQCPLIGVNVQKSS
jgi:hypothetical protein